MSWEGELSDQEVSQMDQESAHHPAAVQPPEVEAPVHHSPPHATAAVVPEPELNHGDPTLRTLKTEPIQPEEAEEELDEDEHEMEGIQSVGPGSPQPMCTNTGEGLDADEQQQFVMPPPALVHPHHHHPPVTEIKTELPWSECPKTDLVSGVQQHPSPPLTSTAGGANSVAVTSNSGSTPSLPQQQRPTFGDAFTGHTPLASPLTSRHPIRLPLAAASGKSPD